MPGQGANRERILVCVSASPTSSDVIRRAAALSRAAGAELIALYVEDSETQTDLQEKAVHEHLALAERSGATITTVYGHDPATAIAQYARVSAVDGSKSLVEMITVSCLPVWSEQSHCSHPPFPIES